MRSVLVAVVALGLAGCTDDSGARRTLESSGYTDIQVGGWSPMACDEKDTFTNTFEATNPQGKRVHGVVCCGLLKSCTVRF